MLLHGFNKRERKHPTNLGLRHEHRQAVNADAQPARRDKPGLKGVQKILINLHGLRVSRRGLERLLGQAAALF